MAASSQYYSVSARVGVPSRHEVEVTIPLVGPAGPAGEGGGGAVESVNGQTGVVVLAAVDVGAVATSVLTTQGDIVVRGASAPQRLALGTGAGKPLVVGASGPEWSVADSNYVLSQSVKVFNAGSDEVDGVYLPTDSINGKVAYRKDDYTISWDGTAWIISGNTTDYYTSSDNTAFPWQATTWSVDSGDSPYPDVEQAAFSDLEAVLGTKSYNTRTPNSHTHGNLTNAGAIGTTSGLPVKTGTSGVLEAGAFGTAAGQFAEGNHTHTPASLGAAQAVTIIELEPNSTTTITTAQLPARGIAFTDGEMNFTVNLPTPGKRQSGLTFSIKRELEDAGGAVFITVVHNSVNLLTSYELEEAEGSIDFLWDGYEWTQDSFYYLRSTPSRYLLLPASSGILALTSDFAAPPAIGNTTPNTLAGTQLALHDGSDTGTFVAASKLTANRTYDLPDASGTLALLETLPAGGTKTYAVFTATDNQPPATAFATLDTRNSIAVLDFDATTDESAVFVGIIPEGASLGSGLKVRLHWMATSATADNCRWGVQFEKSGTDLDSDSFDTAAEAHSAANGTSGIETVTEITITTIDSLAAGDRFRLKVFRNADDVTNDTMTGDAELIAVEVRSAA
jgi:hypothetical protein